MVLDFKIKKKPGYLLITFKGEFVRLAADEFASEIIRACENHQPTKLLIDMRKVKGRISAMDRFKLAAVSAPKYIRAVITRKIPSCRIAFLGSSPLLDPRKFGETVAVNRGLNVKVFTDLKEALAWLKR